MLYKTFQVTLGGDPDPLVFWCVASLWMLYLLGIGMADMYL